MPKVFHFNIYTVGIILMKLHEMLNFALHCWNKLPDIARRQGMLEILPFLYQFIKQPEDNMYYVADKF